jgi:hypothetical protein
MNTENELHLKCSGEFCRQETVLNNNDSITITNPSKENDDDAEESSVVQGIFSLKYLTLFTKCTNLSNVVQIYLKNDYPLIIEYTVASLGKIKLCLSPQIN